MQCSIQWNTLDLPEWEARFSRIRRSTLLQSYDYAVGACPFYGQRARWGLITINGQEAGLVQMLEAGILGLHGLVIDRGPLWLPGFGTMPQIKAFLDALNAQFPKRFGRRRRFIPEIPDSPAGRALIAQSGWVYKGPDYTTSWLDLTKSSDDLRAALKGNWRNHLNKAEKGPLLLEWDTSTKSLPEIISVYAADQAGRGYQGPDKKLVDALARSFAAKEKCLIGRALLDNRAVAAILILTHGCSATYQIGWSMDEGRQHGGHYRLLWSSLELLKSKGITDFDLGGIHEDAAGGVTDFKDGMGGQRSRLSGLFI